MYEFLTGVVRFIPKKTINNENAINNENVM